MTTERTHEAVSNGTGKVQVIGDRKVINPRIRVAQLRDMNGNVFETVRLSLEFCGCGYSYARPGVGYRGDDGWHCKCCGQLHTLDRGAVASDEAQLKPDPALAREFDEKIARVSPDWSTPEDLEASR